MALNVYSLAKDILIGGLVGAGVALVYAPKGGKHLHHNMSMTVAGWKRSMKKTSDELLDNTRDMMNSITKTVTSHHS